MIDFKNHHSVRHSILDVVVIVGILLFSLIDFRLFLGIVLNNDFLANGVWLFSFGILFILSILYISYYRFPPYIYLIILVGILGLLIRFSQNASPGILLNVIASYMLIPLFYVSVLKKKIDLVVLTKIILFFTVVHIVGVIGDESFLREGMDKYTVWGASSVMQGRSTGFMVAPGVLSFMAVFVTVYSTVVYRLTSNKMALILIFLGLFIGVYSGNRSYVVATSLVLFIVLFTLNYKKGALDKFYMILRYIVFLSILIGFSVYYFGDLIEQTLLRFNMDDLVRTIETRLEGSAGFIPNLFALIDSPILGPLEYSSRGPYTIYNGEKITVSNGILSIFVSNGLLVGSAYFAFYVRGFILLWHSTRERALSEFYVINNALFYCYIGLGIVSITDALLETILMKLIIVYANMPRIRKDFVQKPLRSVVNSKSVKIS